MIPLETIKATPAGELFIYEAPGQPGVFYSGRTIQQPRELTQPLYLRLVPTDKRLPPTQLAIGDRNLGKPVHFIRELAFNHCIAFQVSEEDLTGSRDLRQNLLAQAKGDHTTEQAIDYLLQQLAEVRRNFIPSQN